MKRIQLQCSFFILSFFLLTSCSSFIKSGKYQTKFSYLNAERIKLAHYERELDSLLVNVKLDSKVVFKTVVNDNTIHEENNIEYVIEDLCSHYESYIGSSGIGNLNTDYYDLLAEEKCCDPAHNPCKRMCKCYLISAELEHILSNDLLHDLTIAEIGNENNVFARIKKPYHTKIGNTYTYELNYLFPLEVNETYMLTLKPIVDGDIETYTAYVTTY